MTGAMLIVGALVVELPILASPALSGPWSDWRVIGLLEVVRHIEE